MIKLKWKESKPWKDKRTGRWQENVVEQSATFTNEEGAKNFILHASEDCSDFEMSYE
jgi:hypothetical protein